MKLISWNNGLNLFLCKLACRLFSQREAKVIVFEGDRETRDYDKATPLRGETQSGGCLTFEII